MKRSLIQWTSALNTIEKSDLCLRILDSIRCIIIYRIKNDRRINYSYKVVYNGLVFFHAHGSLSIYFILSRIISHDRKIRWHDIICCVLEIWCRAHNIVSFPAPSPTKKIRIQNHNRNKPPYLYIYHPYFHLPLDIVWTCWAGCPTPWLTIEKTHA